MRRSPFIFLLLAVALAGCAPVGETRVLPQAELELLDGGSYDLQQTGQPRALNLWATWCAPCRAELPAFDEVAGRVSGVDIIGVNTGDTGDAAAGLVEELGLSFTQVLDPVAEVQSGLAITGLPATVFVDADGDIVKVQNGELDAEELEELLTDLLDASFDSE